MSGAQTNNWILLLVMLATITSAQAQMKKEILNFGDRKGTVHTISFYKGGSELAIAESSSIKFYDVSTQHLIKEFHGGHSDVILSIDISLDSAYLISGGRDGLVVLWDITKETPIKKLDYHNGVLTSVKFSPDRRYILSGSTDNRVILYDIESEEIVYKLSGHTDHITAVSYSPDGKTIASASADQTIRFWEAETGNLISIIDGLKAWPRSISFSSDSTQFIFCGDDSKVSVWDIRNLRDIKSLREARFGYNWLLSVDFNDSGRAIATGGMDGKIRIDHRFGGYTYKLGKPITQILIKPTEDATLEVAAATMGMGVILIHAINMKLKPK